MDYFLSGAHRFLVAVPFLAVFAVGCEDDNAIDHPSSSNVAESRVEVDSVVPDQQLRFVQNVSEFASQYEDAVNEIRMTELRKERREWLATNFRDPVVNSWVGTIDEIRTNSSGDASVSITLAGSRHITVETWGNALSDISDGTMIKSGSSLYRILSNIRVGTRVRFSAVFMTSQKDHLFEASVSESGSMLRPEFIVRFSSIEPTGK